MDDEASSSPPPLKKRRIPKACAACRRSKLRCDLERPCSRCVTAQIDCEYFERPKDPNVARIEHLEQELNRINQTLDVQNVVNHQQDSPSTAYSVVAGSHGSWHEASMALARPPDATTDSVTSSTGHHTSLVGYSIRQTSSIDIVSSGLVREDDARTWFATFFAGAVWYVPVFDLPQDTFESIRSRSNILFDTIVVIGARAAHGALSQAYQSLYPILRQHTSDLMMNLSAAASRITIENIQALLVIASYSDNGAVLCDVAVQACIEAGLPTLVNNYLATMTGTSPDQPATMRDSQARHARIWYYAYVLDMILSVDGGKPATITIPPTAARRVRLLLHPRHSTAPDFRLYAQVELNSIRSASHTSISTLATTNTSDTDISSTLSSTNLDLSLWLSDWQTLLTTSSIPNPDRSTIEQNLQIQHAWATLILHLRALAATGIDNIALMTPIQRTIALSAKAAAEQHFQLVMTRSDDTTTLPYIASFRYAMEFVWAKNAFCVLIVLRLSILLGDTVQQLSQKLSEARVFLNELGRVGMGANTRILEEIVGKCEAAVRAAVDQTGGEDVASGEEFERFVPKEFMFDWDFPGVRLHYIPLDWQDLLFDVGVS